ncbi:SLC26A/SulP transporter family protein [Caldimonas sp. KR1-144]|uniref:SLC26A/SulP transporter family protein n=1 Tax=Caldimonas sp. KR1-144 TaxID=3400911 RepID=UPI003C05030B
MSSALTHAPENAAYGLMALAPLGATFSASAMALALFGAAIACAVSSLAGGGRLAVDAGAALALLTTGLVAALLPLVPGPATEAPAQVLGLVALGIAAGGVLTALFGLLRIGALVKYTPQPVRAGLATGVGLLLIGSASTAVMGHGFNAGLAELPVHPLALVVGLTALALTWIGEHRHWRVPPVVLALGVATALQAAFAHTWLRDSLGPTVGVPQWPPFWFGASVGAQPWGALLGNPAVLALLGGYALTAALVISLDALLAASLIDGRLRRSRNANRELVAQGIANLASAAVGGLPASPAIPASTGLVTRSPQQRHIVLAYAAALLGVLLLAPQLLGVLPVSAVGGVLVALGLSMVSSSLWLTPLELWRQRRDGDGQRQRDLGANWLVTVVVALCCVAQGLGLAVLVGATFAVLLFVRSNLRDVVRLVRRGDQCRSLKTRSPAVSEALRRHGQRLAVLDLEGPLFFGTADALRAELQGLAPQVDTAILDLHRVGELDVTAARILGEAAEDWQRMGKTLVFAEWDAQDPRRATMAAVARSEGLAVPRFDDDADAALEEAEDRLLEQLHIERPDDQCLALAETMIARGLTADELELLAAELTQHEFAKGQVLFRVGDPGDAIYISLRGEIGLRLPGTMRRLVSFAPGASIGEMAVLGGSSRSAEAVAESDVTALVMSLESFQRLTQQHPALTAKLITNMALHLADRVRVLTSDLASRVAPAA